jgi:predicted DCC family thiol-disulfide oxidoreductase YuxK
MGFWKLLKNSLGFDYRSMALYRFLMGIIVMADVAYRWQDLTNLYSDVGLIPRSIFLNEMAMKWSFSFHLANGSTGFAVAMFSIHFILGLMLCLGYKTRLATLGCFLMTVSVHNRNWLVNNGGDDVMRAILFLSIFLPLNRWFSVDSALAKNQERPKNESYMSFWVMAFTFQVFAIYFISYILKNHAIWRSDFTAIYFASRLDIFTTPIGVWTRNFPTFQKISTIYTALLEWIGPLLLVFPWIIGPGRWWIIRMLVVIMFWFLHLGIIATMWIGVFPYMCLVMWCIFIPGPVWDKVFAYFRRKNFGNLKLYFDEECRFCKKCVYLIREFFLLPEVSIAPTQSVAEINSLMQKERSWVVVNEKKEKFTHFEAFVEVMRHSPCGFWKVWFFSLGPVKKIGNVLYRWVANHRPLMGNISQYFAFTETKKEIRPLKWLRELLGAIILMTLVAWNLSTLKALNYDAGTFGSIARWLHLYQEWNMFAPYPKMDNVWLEVNGELDDGTTIDVLTGSRDIFSVRDQSFYQSVQNEHWRKFYLNLTTKTDYARYFGGYLCRRWNDRKYDWGTGRKLVKMEIASYSQMNLLNNEKGSINKKLTWKHWCFDKDFDRDNPDPAKKK